MLNFKKLAALTAISTVLASPAFALIGSSDVIIPGGEIKPASVFGLSVSKLVEGVSYSLQCNLNNPSHEDIVIAALASDTSFHLDFKVDGQYSESQVAIKPGRHIFTVVGFYHTFYYSGMSEREHKLEIVNADQDSSILLDNCVASANS